MAHAEKCPLCKGAGTVKEKTCHGCNGKGWVTVAEEPEKETKFVTNKGD